MKKTIFTLIAFLVTTSTVFASAGETTVDTPSGKMQDQAYVVAPTDEVTIAASMPAGTDTRFVFKIPPILTGGMSDNLPGKCSIIRRLEVPALIVCLGVNGKLDFSFTGNIAESGNKSGFVAARGYLVDGTRWNHFEKITFEMVASSTNTPTPTPDKPDTGTTPEQSPTPTPDNQDVSSITNPNDIPTHKRSLSDPETQIIVDESKQNIVAVALFDAQIEPVVIEKLTVQLDGVNTAGLYSDTDNDIDMINAVSLFYQDGTPVMTKTGAIAKTEAITANGKAALDNLNIAFPEGGERLYIAVDTREILEDYSGAAVKATFSFDQGDATVRGFWSKKPYENIVLSPNSAKSPVAYIFANKLVAEVRSGGSEFLRSGKNEILPFRLDVLGNDEAYFKQVIVNIETSSSGDGFRVTELRLRRAGNIVASRSGGDLSGNNTLTIGQCIGGDACEADEVEGDPLFRATDYVLEAVVVPNDNLDKNNTLTASVTINSAAPGSDGIVWQDYGTDGEDGKQIRWIDLGSESSVSRIERTISTP